MEQKQSEFIEELILQHSRHLSQHAFRKIFCRETAEDLVQETFLIACCKIDTLICHQNPKAWLFDTLNKLILREQSKAYRQDLPLPDSDTPGCEEIDLPMADYLPQGLTEEEQKLIMLRVEMGYTSREIAEQLGIYETACRKRVSRALKKCRDLFSLQPPVKK